jgi:hypothetical protein
VAGNASMEPRRRRRGNRFVERGGRLVDLMLQWSRGVAAAETTAVIAPHPRTSCFNGAAASPPRKQDRVASSAVVT